MGFSHDSGSKESACDAGDLGSIPGLGRSPGGGMATHTSILAWRIPIGSQRDRHHWATKHTYMACKAWVYSSKLQLH